MKVLSFLIFLVSISVLSQQSAAQTPTHTPPPCPFCGGQLPPITKPRVTDMQNVFELTDLGSTKVKEAHKLVIGDELLLPNTFILAMADHIREMTNGIIYEEKANHPTPRATNETESVNAEKRNSSGLWLSDEEVEKIIEELEAAKIDSYYPDEIDFVLNLLNFKYPGLTRTAELICPNKVNGVFACGEIAMNGGVYLCDACSAERIFPPEQLG